MVCRLGPGMMAACTSFAAGITLSAAPVPGFIPKARADAVAPLLTQICPQAVVVLGVVTVGGDVLVTPATWSAPGS